jgi:thioredoxin-related protein
MPSCLNSKAAKSFNNPRGIVIDRRQFSTALAATLAVAAGLVHANDTALPVLTSLPQAAQASKAQGQPLVLLISLPGCVYCEMVRRNYLMPLLPEAGLQAWQLESTDSSSLLIGFDGKLTNAAAQAKAWKATFTPTVLFLGSQGQELADRLVGIAVPDFYGAYLDQRLAEAHKAL